MPSCFEIHFRVVVHNYFFIFESGKSLQVIVVYYLKNSKIDTLTQPREITENNVCMYSFFDVFAIK